MAVVGALARRLAGAAAALGAGAALALLPAHVVASVFYAEDAYAVCAAALSLFFFGERRGGRSGDMFWAGVFAGTAAAFRLGALVLPVYYLMVSIAATFRPGGGSGRKWLWLAGFAAFLAAAAGVAYWRTGDAFGYARSIVAAAPVSYAGAAEVVRRVGAGAAAMLCWDLLGFAGIITLALGGSAFYVRDKNRPLLFYAGFLVLILVVYNFMTVSSARYAPQPLEPRRWLLASVPAALLVGGVVAELWAARNGVRILAQWAGAFGLAFIAAALFVNGNMPFAPVFFLTLASFVVITWVFAGWARRKGALAATLTRVSCLMVVLILTFPVVILFL